PDQWPSYTDASDSYQPAAKLKLLAEARDGGCVTPNCRAPATRCDLDHRAPFNPDQPADQQTTAGNLQTLCRACHLRKTHHHWDYQHNPQTGTTTIRTPNTS
ncbi:MAG: HNH endonuclease, partial [Bifidobacteriaceae bacterium]|nr:HNH endonuclease [Bifidobacteriaceae bacterium]